MQVVLASASPRRKELLKEIISEFEIIPSAFDESGVDISAPYPLVERLAQGKAEEVALRKENEGKIVLGSDTVVAYGSEVLGKPQDEKDAERMLKLLSGKKHSVFTGVCFALAKEGKILFEKRAVAETEVHFLDLTEEFIQSYIQTGSPMDKAGAYGIQDGGLVDKIEGSYSCVVGLPVELVKDMWKEIQSEGLAYDKTCD